MSSKTPRSSSGRQSDWTTGSDKPRISEKARQRPVRVIPAADDDDMQAGHLIAAAYGTNRPDREESSVVTFGSDRTPSLMFNPAFASGESSDSESEPTREETPDADPPEFGGDDRFGSFR